MPATLTHSKQATSHQCKHMRKDMESNQALQTHGGEQIFKFVKRQRELLDLERDAFVKSQLREIRELVNSLKVKVSDVCVPTYGGTIASCKTMLSKTETRFPAFKTGNLVCVDLLDGSNPLNGILVRISGEKFNVHIKDSSDILKEREIFDLVKTTDDGEFEQLENALDGIKENSSQLRDLLFGLTLPSKQKLDVNSQPCVLINKSLDDSQKAAVEFANAQKELAVIHGPPGTGKTTTLVEIICQVSIVTTIYNLKIK